MNTTYSTICRFTRWLKNDTFPIMNITCAILAGGFSTRIGQDKATLKINGKALIKHVSERMQNVFQNIVIVSNNHSGFADIDAPVIKDILPIKTPMVGILSALLYSNSPYVFACACDMPFINEAVVRYMIDKINGADIIIPKTEKGFEPLCALYNRTCISHMFTLIERNRLKISGIFPALTINMIEDNPSFYNNGYSVFTNINTLGDLEMMKDKVVNREEKHKV